MEVKINEGYETILYPDVLDNKYSLEDDLNGSFKHTAILIIRGMNQSTHWYILN